MNVITHLKKKRPSLSSCAYIHPALTTHGGIPWCTCWTSWHEGCNLAEKKTEEGVPPYLQGNVSNNLTNCSLCVHVFSTHIVLLFLSEMIRLEVLHSGPLLLKPLCIDSVKCQHGDEPRIQITTVYSSSPIHEFVRVKQLPYFLGGN